MELMIWQNEKESFRDSAAICVQLAIVMTILVVRISVIGIKRQLLFGLEWVNLTQMTIISTTVGSLRSLVGSTTKESLRRNGVAIMVNKSLKSSTWMQSQK